MEKYELPLVKTKKWPKIELTLSARGAVCESEGKVAKVAWDMKYEKIFLLWVDI